MTVSDTDPFWVEARADFLAKKSTAADPNACGTCRDLVEAFEPVMHDECQQRATLLHAPDHPHYELLAGFSLEENAALPPRFHVPVFDDCGKPNAWLCAVCQDEGVVTGWPCATATKYGTQVFTSLHEAETAHQKQTTRIAELEDQVTRLLGQQAQDDDEFVQATAERDRFRLAWQSARERAQAYGEGILRITRDRESYQQWLKQEQGVTQQLRERIAEVRTEALAEAKSEVVDWLVKKSHEGTEVARLADKVERGAIRLFHDAEVAAAARTPQHFDKVPDPLDGCHWCACGNRWPCKDAREVTA